MVSIAASKPHTHAARYETLTISLPRRSERRSRLGRIAHLMNRREQLYQQLTIANERALAAVYDDDYQRYSSRANSAETELIELDAEIEAELSLVERDPKHVEAA